MHGAEITDMRFKEKEFLIELNLYKFADLNFQKKRIPPVSPVACTTPK